MNFMKPPKWIALNTSKQNLHDKFCISILIYATPRFMWPPHTCLAIAFLLICFDFNERDDWDSIPSASFPRPAAWHVHDIILRAFSICHLHGVFVYPCKCWKPTNRCVYCNYWSCSLHMHRVYLVYSSAFNAMRSELFYLFCSLLRGFFLVCHTTLYEYICTYVIDKSITY